MPSLAAPLPPPMKTAPKKTFGWLKYIPPALLAIWWLSIILNLVSILEEAESYSPPTTTSSSASSDLEVAQSLYEINDSNTRGAPQQQVVNGWFVRDTIPIVIEQLEDLHADAEAQRVQSLETEQALFSLVFMFVLGVSGDFFIRRVFGKMT